jgi:ADP-ribose pyrophosphatase
MAADGNEEKEILYAGRFLRMVRRGRWEYAERLNICGIVGIVAVTPEGKILLVEQFRPAVNARVIELPAGLAGDVSGCEHEDLAEAARRELEEETGYTTERMTFLTEGPPSSGMSDEVIALYRADGLRKIGDGGGDHTEDITVHEVPLHEVPTWLQDQRRRGVLLDLRIYTALYFLAQKLEM